MVLIIIYLIMQGISVAILLVRVEMGLQVACEPEVDNKTSIIRFAAPTSNRDTAGTLP